MLNVSNEKVIGQQLIELFGSKNNHLVEPMNKLTTSNTISAVSKVDDKHNQPNTENSSEGP